MTTHDYSYYYLYYYENYESRVYFYFFSRFARTRIQQHTRALARDSIEL